jgi:hypothetical protein
MVYKKSFGFNMKTLLFILVVSFSSLYADSIYNGKCVSSFSTSNSTTSIFINYTNGQTSTISESKSKIQELRNNRNAFTYDAVNNKCIAIMTDNTKTFMSSLVGILIGFSILFYSILITIKVGSKR